jgi:hypothetical protein
MKWEFFVGCSIPFFELVGCNGVEKESSNFFLSSFLDIFRPLKLVLSGIIPGVRIFVALSPIFWVALCSCKHNNIAHLVKEGNPEFFGLPYFSRF